MEIKNLQNQIKDTIKNLQEKKSEVYLDPLLMGEFKILKELLIEKEGKIKAKEEELNSLQVTQNKYIFLLILVLNLSVWLTSVENCIRKILIYIIMHKEEL